MTRLASILRLARLPGLRPTAHPSQECTGARATPARRTLGLSLATSMLLGLTGTGCDFSSLTEGSGHLIIRTAHHGEADANGFPELVGQGGSREFKNNLGWKVTMADAIVMTKKVEVMLCPPPEPEEEDEDEDSEEDSDNSDKSDDTASKEDSEVDSDEEEDSDEEDSEEESEDRGNSPNSVADEDDLPENGEWVEIPRTRSSPALVSEQDDGSGITFAENGAMKPGEYCWVRITFDEFEEPDEDEDEENLPKTKQGDPVPEAIYGKTAFISGRATKGSSKSAIKFSVALEGRIRTILDIRESSGGPLRIRSSRQPVALTLSKVYDRFLDNVDFSSSKSSSQVRAAMRDALENETYVSVGKDPKANLAKKKSKDL